MSGDKFRKSGQRIDSGSKSDSSLHVPTPSVDGVAAALATALTAAAAAGRWEVVSQLARELEARRRGSVG